MSINQIITELDHKINDHCHCHMAACKLENVGNINNLTFTNLKFDFMLFRYLSNMDIVLFLWMIVVGFAHGDNTLAGNDYIIV